MKEWNYCLSSQIRFVNDATVRSLFCAIAKWLSVFFNANLSWPFILGHVVTLGSTPLFFESCEIVLIKYSFDSEVMVSISFIYLLQRFSIEHFPMGQCKKQISFGSRVRSEGYLCRNRWGRPRPPENGALVENLSTHRCW